MNLSLEIRIAALLFILFGSAMAQNPEPKKIRHSFGYALGAVQIKEMNLIPKVHRGVSNGIYYSFEKMGNKYQSFSFSIGYGKLKTEIEEEAVSFNAGAAFNYSYTFQIIHTVNFKYFSGPLVSFTSSLSEYENWDEAHAYWGNSLSLGPGNHFFINLKNRNYLAAHLNITIIGFYTRPDCMRLYANEYWTFSNIIKIMNRDYRFGLWSHTFQMNFSAEYRIPLFGNTPLAISYSFYYSRIKAEDGNSLSEIIHKMGIGVVL
jgi:hypothetical protein